MGMDVYGLEPTNKYGEYHRQSVWTWRPFWTYLVANCSDIIDEETQRLGHGNDGAGLNKEDSIKLANRIGELIASGHAQAYKDKYDEEVAVAKSWNNAVDKLLKALHSKVVLKGYHDNTAPKDYPEVENHHWHKLIDMRDYQDSYPFEILMLQEFQEFLEVSGGFEIW